jgi:hypothetical protein
VLDLGHGTNRVSLVGQKSGNIIKNAVPEKDIVVVPETDMLVGGLKTNEVVRGLQSNHLGMDLGLEDVLTLQPMRLQQTITIRFQKLLSHTKQLISSRNKKII